MFRKTIKTEQFLFFDPFVTSVRKKAQKRRKRAAPLSSSFPVYRMYHVSNGGDGMSPEGVFQP
jgi:hypothetical protein